MNTGRRTALRVIGAAGLVASVGSNFAFASSSSEAVGATGATNEALKSSQEFIITAKNGAKFSGKTNVEVDFLNEFSKSKEMVNALKVSEISGVLDTANFVLLTHALENFRVLTSQTNSNEVVFLLKGVRNG